MSFCYISGIIWPIESIPQWLRYISYCSPLTFAVEAIRCILARGKTKFGRITIYYQNRIVPENWNTLDLYCGNIPLQYMYNAIVTDLGLYIPLLQPCCGSFYGSIEAKQHISWLAVWWVTAWLPWWPYKMLLLVARNGIWDEATIIFRCQLIGTVVPGDVA